MDDLTGAPDPRARPAAASDEGAAPAELATMQAALVRAALHGTSLPGGAPSVALPDRAFLPAAGPVPLAEDHLAPTVLAQIRDEARAARDDDAAFLRFRQPRREADALWLTLEVVLRDAGVAAPHPLGGVQAGFTRTPDGWRATAAPRAYAT